MARTSAIDFSRVADGERLPVELPTMANGALHKQVGEKPHLDSLDPLALAIFATSAFGIEAETSQLVAQLFGMFGAGENPSYFVEDSCVSRRVGAGSATDRRLVDVDQTVEFASAT